MITGPKYKIARRVGAPIFEKTQTQKYAMRLERKQKSKSFSKPKSEFAIQMNEKQKTRFVYGLSEKQFSNYFREASAKKSAKATSLMFEYLERRLDNVVYRMGFASTRAFARQLVSHGHFTVNGRRVTTPSLRVTEGDIIAIREGSKAKTVFGALDERFKTVTVPNWIKVDIAGKSATIVGIPQLSGTDTLFDLNAVVEFYSR